MRMQCIDYPRPVARERYVELIDRMVAKIASWAGADSVYQIGGISSPGISDIDLVVIFKDGTSFTGDPRSELQPAERYLLSHGLYGIHESNFIAAQMYTFFHNYRHLYGKPQSIQSENNTSDSLRVIKHQVAIEYLLRMYMALAVQITYRVIKVRSLLLTAKAVGYDLDFLGIAQSPLRDSIEQLTAWRNIWFTKPPSREEITTWTVSFFRGVEKLLRELLENIGFYYASAERYRAARHLQVVNRQPLSYTHTGVVMPSWIGARCPKWWFGIHDRLNTFRFCVPVRDVQDNPILQQKGVLENRLLSEGHRHLPHFLPLKSALNLQGVC
jgi:hypothetical protein